MLPVPSEAFLDRSLTAFSPLRLPAGCGSPGCAFPGGRRSERGRFYRRYYIVKRRKPFKRRYRFSEHGFDVVSEDFA